MKHSLISSDEFEFDFWKSLVKVPVSFIVAFNTGAPLSGKH